MEDLSVRYDRDEALRTLPADLDPECRELCEALNLLPGITTIESCCGHGRTPYRIWFTADSLDALPPVCWCADGCHSGEYGWKVSAMTDCGLKPVDFYLEGPASAYAASEKIAKLVREIAGELAEPDEDRPDDD